MNDRINHRYATGLRFATLVVPAQFEWIDRDLPTASWWDKYLVQPGRYPLVLKNVGGDLWNPDLNVPTPGFIANVGPDHAGASIDALLIESYREARLLDHVTHDLKHVVPARQQNIGFFAYTFSLKHGARFYQGNAYVEVPELPEPCSDCGWQYGEDVLRQAADGKVVLDPTPTHLCESVRA